MAAKRKTVTQKTFLKWQHVADFDYEVDENDDLSVLKCKVCTTYLGEIRKEARIMNIYGYTKVYPQRQL